MRLSSPELVKEFVLKKGEARLSAVYRLFNRREAGADLKLRTHAEFTPGGQVSSDDGCFYPVGPSGKRIPFRVGHASPFFENLGGWLAVCDAGRRKGVIQTFRTNAVGKLYYCMSEQACNFEATTPEEQVAPGQALEFACDWGLIQGVSGVAGYAAGVAVEIATPESGVFGRGAAVPLVIEATALWPVDCLARIAIERPDGSRTNLHAATWRLAPDAPIRLPLDWNTGRLPDGDYRIVVDLRIPDGSPLLTTVRELRLAGDRQAALHAETQPWRERLQERIATSRALADGEAREREMAGATRLAVLLNAYEAAVAATDAAAIEALRGDIQWLLDPPEDHAPAE